MTFPSSWHAPACLALVAVMAVLLLTCGCTQQASQTQAGIAPVQTTVSSAPVPVSATLEAKKMVTYTEKDNGTTADIAANTRFAVQLEENPTTGYSWNATRVPAWPSSPRTTRRIRMQKVWWE